MPTLPACLRLRSLTSFFFQHCELVTDVGVRDLVTRCVNLEHLDVTSCPRVTCPRLADAALPHSLQPAATRHLQKMFLR